MDIIVRNLHDQVTEPQVQDFFKPHLAKIGIYFSHCQKLRARGCATITIHDSAKGERFLLTHGQREHGPKGFQAVRIKLYLRNRAVWCLRSTKPTDEYIVKALQKQESDRYAALSRQPKIMPPRADDSGPKKARGFPITKARVGQWTYVRDALTFSCHHTEQRSGRIIFGSRAVAIKLQAATVDTPSHQLEIPYESIVSFVVFTKPPSLTLSLSEAPKLFEELQTSLNDAFRGLLLHSHQHQYKRKRISSLNPEHAKVVGSCHCYRFSLPSWADVHAIQALKIHAEIPDIISWNVSVITDSTYTTQVTQLNSALATGMFATAPFEVKFQVQRLAQNGYLSPSRVIELMPHLLSRLRVKKNATVASAVRHLAETTPYAGPDADAGEFSLSSLLKIYQQSENSVFENDPYSIRLSEEYDHMTMVHKALVTPTGITLSGPQPEIKNRVLRGYPVHADYFLSVTFADENGDALRFDRLTSSKEVYHTRFKNVLEGVVNIAGRGYEFLGFSHSSLREQTCWFMAPFTLNKVLTHARLVIQRLGDFGQIRSPAKCAARIGQAFSQTLSAIPVSLEAFIQMDDIERNERIFSDGVGTCSEVVLQKIWEGYNEARLMKLKPTIFQIRYQGAKGVISLDKRLQGEKLCLRPSMIKFHGSPGLDIEICGSARKPLPMYLNRQLIKILEDLGVPDEGFLELQRDAVEELRMMTISPINASSFFDRNRISTAAQLPWLIKKLHYIGLDFQGDELLRDTLELAVLTQLRDIKHRSRINVESGWTLYGILDETGFLQENEIYCVAYTDDSMQTLTGNMVITRCPALHPGDVQCVTAVDVPTDSPLRALHNMVVFSQHGARDLPSQLSGGDLDGDLYNVIWDHRLYPRMLHTPASYDTPKPIDIGRMVERADITDFFVTFMENDNLGMIATLHQILADRNPQGTLDPECVKVAGLHSTAVDFSKSGRPVDRLQIPRYPRARPDFQAPGPHALIKKEITLEEILSTEPPDQSDEVDEVNSYGPPKVMYYQSQKVLGELYRDIDEFDFLEHMQAHAKGKAPRDTTLLDAVWKHVSNKTYLIQWRHCLDFARNVKENYEENLTDTIICSSPHPNHPITEIEVFAGSILGSYGAQNKRQREATITMNEKFDRDVRYITSWIRGGDGDDEDGCLERSLACLYVGAKEAGKSRKVGALRSFAWVAAAICLKEVDKLGTIAGGVGGRMTFGRNHQSSEIDLLTAKLTAM